MSDAAERAAGRLNALHARRPDVTRLAQVASLAVRIEGHLLRRLRLDCVREADVGTEADLWFSALVESRGTSAIVLEPQVARLLRDDLATHRDLLEQAFDITEAAHRQSPEALRIEERVNALALLHKEAAVPDISAALQPAVRALRESDTRGREIARWWLRAAPRMPAVVWQSETALALLFGASALLNRRILPDDVPMPSQALGQLAWAVPVPSAIASFEIGVDLDRGRLEFRDPATSSATIRVPATTPPLVEVRWTSGDRERRAVYEIARDMGVDLETDVTHVAVHTLRGAVYEVRMEPKAMAERKRICFVSMGFGEKTDYETAKTFDLDKSYRFIIKPAAEQAGFECIRADEIVHAGAIDVPMYEQLLNADIVVSDLTAGVKSAYYELGIRHALRPAGTIVIAEDSAKYFPFDVNHVVVRRYHHLGKGIDFGEVERMRRELSTAIVAIADAAAVDSPVYTFLPDLVPPSRGVSSPDAPAAAAPRPQPATPAMAALIEQANTAMNDSAFEAAKRLLAAARESTPSARNDAYLLQRLALATYKSKSPTPRAALEEALAVLAPLSPTTSNDPETLGLYGAVRKRLWDDTHTREHLDEAVRAFERGFYLKQDYYNGSNLAFMLNVRATISEPADAIADFVLARRIREQVIAICERLLDDAATGQEPDTRFWILSTLAEAWTGVGNPERGREYVSRAMSEPVAEWMRTSTSEQLSKLEPLLQNSPLRFIRAAAS